MIQTKILPLGAAILVSMMTLVGCQNTTPIEQSNQKIEQTQDNAKMTQVNTADAKQAMTIDQLSQYHWKLLSAVDGNNKPMSTLEAGKEVARLSFQQQQGQIGASFGVGCNAMNGQAALKGNVLTLSQVISTEMMCDPQTNQAETLLAQAMQGSSQLALKAGTTPILTQVAANKTTLVWQGVMTAEAKYGPGETVFWAVDHKAQPCPDGSAKACLKIKPITYNDQGIKTSEGDWSLFNGEIEGYTHDGKHDEVLRLQHYIVNPTDVKGNKNVYVLDTVIETQAVK
ncbi:MAG: META domain-containing protein [Psychrobacter sp.]|nr:META domain-containing protein [Psychrobacter sp.]